MDRTMCDADGVALAVAEIFTDNGSLYLCEHHFRENETVLLARYTVVKYRVPVKNSN
jgi:hypothetical protein